MLATLNLSAVTITPSMGHPLNLTDTTERDGAMTSGSI